MPVRGKLVYSTEEGRLANACPRCRSIPCRCKPATSAPAAAQTARIQRSSKGHAGKTVTSISGLALAPSALADLATELRKGCGTGGTIKDGVIELQGDQREAAGAILQARGIKVKFSGG